MHALRAPPKIGTPKTPATQRALAVVKDLIKGTDEYIYSYTRRAARPNELFLVMPFEKAGELRARFLAGLE